MIAVKQQKEFPERKHPRLKNFDYSSVGAYFLTLCTKNREPTLGKITVGRLAFKPPNVQGEDIFVELSDIGKITDKYIQNINKVYDGICVDKYIIMPDHIHLLIIISGGLRASRPTEKECAKTICTVVRSLKRMINKEISSSIWQESFFDHVIRNNEDFYQTRKYIEENPARWYYKNR